MLRRAASLVALGSLLVMGCEGADYGDPGPSWGGFDFTLRTQATYTKTLVLVVDDRPTVDAVALRADIGAGVRHVGADILGKFRITSPDRAAWRPVDVRVVLVPASSPSIESVVSPATHPGLAWTTHQASTEGRDALALAVDAEVKRMIAGPGAPFRPLERARDVIQLLEGTRAAFSESEKSLVASLSFQRRQKHFIALSIVTTSDDESPDPPLSYDVDRGREEVPTNVVTPDGRGEEDLDPARFPRLSEWAKTSTASGFVGCDYDVEPPLHLFRTGFCASYRVRCDAFPIEEISPGLGRCYIQITTTDPPMCDRAHGWLDPLDADGVRRPRANDKGEHVCEALPVDAAVMDACIHDETCANCGSGWCVSEVRPRADICPNSPAKVLRWVGGVLPEGGSFRVTCSEARNP